jgi:uncharacterized delta-60 repeat protein
MWFPSARKARRTPPAHSHHGSIRPQVERLEDRCVPSAGTLDSTFGTGGMLTGATAPNFGTSGGIRAVAVQPNGQTVYGGAVYDPNIGHSNFALTRYNADGTLDTTFGNSGTAITTVGTNGNWVTGLALQNDGKIVAVGWSSRYTVFGVVRYNANGTLDSGFGNGGIVLTGLGGSNFNDYACAVAIDGSGKIDVAGTSSQFLNGRSGATASYLTLVRYNANGSLDKTFGSNGIVVTLPDRNYSHCATALAVESDGKIVMAGNSSSHMIEAVRYTPTGQLDTSFAGKGYITGLLPAGSTSAVAMRVIVQSNGGVVIAGASNFGSGYVSTLVQLTSSGQLDGTFGNSGFATNSGVKVANAGNWVQGYNLMGFVQEANGDLLVSGYTVNGNGNTDFAVAAFLSTGAPDTGFGTGGLATADFGGGNDYAYTLFIQSNSEILVAGVTTPPGSSTTDIALALFLAS